MAESLQQQIERLQHSMADGEARRGRSRAAATELAVREYELKSHEFERAG